MESILEEWPKMAYRLIVCGTTIECQSADEAIVLAGLLAPETTVQRTETIQPLNNLEAATQN
jgi:hypothetical protein